MPENSPSVNTISNSAKLLRKVMQLTGQTNAAALATMLEIPVRTIQRLKLEIVDATCASDAIYGAAKCVNDATGGASGVKEIPPTPPKENNTSPRTTVEQASSRANDAETELLAGLNGSTALMISDIAKWANMPEANCRKWLATTVSTFGSEITKAAYQKLQTDIASQAIIAAPLQTMTKIAQRMKSDGPGTSRPAPKFTAPYTQPVIRLPKRVECTNDA